MKLLTGFVTGMAILSFGAIGSLPVHAQSGDIEEVFDVSPGGRLNIISDAGPITVRTWEQSRVQVRVINPEGFDVSLEQSGNEIRVVADDAPGRSRIRFEAQVPREFNLELDTGGGAIEVGDMAGDVYADTSGGAITVGSVENGDVVVDTSGGAIVIGNVVNGDVNADTSGGRITIGNVSGDVVADTSGGVITIGDVDGDVSADTSGGNITVGEVTGNVSLDTSGGTINAGYAGGSMTADTSGGNIELAGSDRLLIADTSGGTIRIARSGGPVQVDTSGGNIFLGPINGYIEADTSGGRIEAVLGNLEPGQDGHIDLDSSGGDIELTLPAGHAATIDARIKVSRRARGDYRIYTDFPLAISGEDDREVIGRGDINGGGDRITIETSNGDIHINRAGN
ncbi:MAG: hypothetical protein R3F41_10545 [Gammaproteobacteria bacterium]|nr:hypothetical protein [Pseudomonadales bacterium]MCP5348046.1 hypothetical protein [Pseudomonadales bacterium]